MLEFGLLMPLCSFDGFVCMQSVITEACNFFQVEYEFSNQKGCGRDVVNELKGHRKEMLVYSN